MHALVAIISAYIYVLTSDSSMIYAAVFTTMTFIEVLLAAFTSAFLLDGAIKPFRMNRWVFRLAMIVRGLFFYSLMTVDIGGWQSIVLKIAALMMGIAYVINTNIEHNAKPDIKCVPPHLHEPVPWADYPDEEGEEEE